MGGSHMNTPSRVGVPLGRFSFVLLVASLCILVTPSWAGASRIDNDTADPGHNFPGDTVYVWFDCGVACGNYFSIDPGSSATRPGKSGHVQMCVVSGRLSDPSMDAEYLRETGSRISVDAHGEVKLRYDLVEDAGVEIPSRGSPHWDSYDADDNLVKSVDHSADTVDGSQFSNYCWSGSP